jgi:hypothetical protein
MRVLPSFLLTSVFLVVSQSGTIAPAEEKLTEEEFKELHDELQPKDEPWRTIPWKIDLLNAQQIAAKEKKPLFIWAMDGHPLGCT